jgi:hypothetical protein
MDNFSGSAFSAFQESCHNTFSSYLSYSVQVHLDLSGFRSPNTYYHLCWLYIETTLKFYIIWIIYKLGEKQTKLGISTCCSDYDRKKEQVILLLTKSVTTLQISNYVIRMVTAVSYINFPWISLS